MRSTLLLLMLCSFALAQEFDVASVKIAPPPTGNGGIFLGGQGGPGTNDPTHITRPGSTLLNMLQAAYDVKNYQINAPDWLTTERYDFSVVVPEGATKEQVGMMWRNLLAARFGLKLRIEQKEFQVDELIVGPRGHKLTESTVIATPPADPPTPPGPPGRIQMDKDGRPILPKGGPGMMIMMNASPSGIKAQAVGRGETMATLATMLASQVRHPVIDKTGLTGKYDFNMEYTPSEVPRGLTMSGPLPAGASGTLAPAAEVGVDIAGALQQQLGLRLVRGKANLDYLIVEKAEKIPTEN